MKIAIIGNSGNIEKSYKRNIEQIFYGLGNNTGNLVFWYAINNHICDKKDFFGWNLDIDYINNNYDTLIFVAANNLNPAWDMGLLANQFEKIKIPILILGLGIQAKNIGDDLKFSDGTKKFIKVIKNKSKYISVRGYYTAQVLKDYDVDNVKITGCPSNFINFENNVDQYDDLDEININRIIINANVLREMKEFLRITSSWKDKGKDIKYLMQDNKEIIEFCRYRKFNKNILKFIRSLFIPNTNLDDTYKFANENFETFFNVDTWLEYLYRFDLAIGTRMHGNMLSFQISIPTIFITHDARVTEMIETMALPTISYEKVIKLKTLKKILSNIKFSPKKYRKKRLTLARNYLKIFQEYGIKYCKELKEYTSKS